MTKWKVLLFEEFDESREFNSKEEAMHEARKIRKSNPCVMAKVVKAGI